MTISNLSRQDIPVSLDDFREAAAAGPELQLESENGPLKVLGHGATPAGVSVAWIKPSVDTSSMFINALKKAFGPSIGASVEQELGLSPSPGKPLPSQLVARALEMAETSQSVLDGVDFKTQLDFSVNIGKSNFQTACIKANVDPDSLTESDRLAIDARMAQNFREAAQRHETPVSEATALQWLSQCVKEAAHAH